MTRVRRVDSQRELERLVDEFITRGYTVKEQGQYSARVKEKNWGSLPVHGFVFLFAFLGSAILFDAAGASAAGVWIVTLGATLSYAGYSWFTAEEVVIKVDRGAGESTGA